MKSFQEFLNESIGAAGPAYEKLIWNSIDKAKVPGLSLGTKPNAGFSNQGAGDIEATYKGHPFNVEAKATSHDQMGGGSLRYDYNSKKFTVVGKDGDASDDDIKLILQAAQKKTKDLDAYIDAARKLKPVAYHKSISGIPLKISKDGREKLKDAGLSANIQDYVQADIRFIINHYNAKGVYYIQIGGAGLFYMGSNPLKLPIPQLSGTIQVELRLAFGGSKLSLPDGTDARSAGLRFQGRLLTTGKSPYSLDNPASIRELFNH